MCQRNVFFLPKLNVFLFVLSNPAVLSNIKLVLYSDKMATVIL